MSFRASLPDKAGISRHSDGATVRLDVPETDVGDMAPLLALTRCALRITVTVEQTDPLLSNTKQSDSPARPQRRRSQRVAS